MCSNVVFFFCVISRRWYSERGHERMRELRGQRDPAVAEGRHRSSSVQRVRPVQSDQRGESAAGQIGPEENYPGILWPSRRPVATMACSEIYFIGLGGQNCLICKSQDTIYAICFISVNLDQYNRH